MKKVGNRRNAIRHMHFFHPDYTVGTGFNRFSIRLRACRLRRFTAGGELRPAPKLS